MAAKGLNALWHGVRGYLPAHSGTDAFISASGSVVGEKLEDLVTHGKGLVGNVTGATVEEGLQWAKNQVQEFMSSPKGTSVSPPTLQKHNPLSGH